MSNLLKKINHVLGIDSSIAFTVLSKIVQVFGGFGSLFLIAKNLTSVEQGYYFTFGSILAIQVFFELGLTGIIVQYVAHENSNLVWKNHISCEGSPQSISRLSSLLRFAVKWFSYTACILIIGLLISGYLFFQTYVNDNSNVDWLTPWVILSITTTLSLLVSPILAFFEGLGMVKEIAKIRLLQQIIQFCLLSLFLALDFKLYSSPLAAIGAFIIIPIWIFFYSKFMLLKFIWNKKGPWHVNYKLEIFPFQWKIALSWISGYFIFQLFNPVLFAKEGPIVAGQMGMTLSVLNTIFSMTYSWISTKIPVFSGFIAKKEFNKLDSLFNKTVIQSTILNIVCLTLFFLVIFVFKLTGLRISSQYLSDRFLPLLPLLIMAIPIALNHITGSWATYMRCHKEEPMLFQSIVIGILCMLSTVLLGNTFGLLGITIGYLSLSVISLIWTYFIFINKKMEWHHGNKK
jgi:O-antigen/teichoic acid export membrane protein